MLTSEELVEIKDENIVMSTDFDFCEGCMNIDTYVIGVRNGDSEDIFDKEIKKGKE